MKALKLLRCAVYTRKSSEEGLEQAFNSLHAQREACEAYIKSQAGEGWELLDAVYDDGGCSGGSMDRPALQRLLADIKDHLVDVIVVYKVDRLTRSLTDFARMVEIFDAHGVSFVSVTQAFNTTTSMGRLTLNVLLSFAQFEREVTGERIRDKIAASKKKGMWMGGNPPLGYEIRNRKLVVQPEEAERVGFIFRRYLELGSVTELAPDLRERKVWSKSWRTNGGTQRGGRPFGRGALYALLKNPLYAGQVVHRGKTYSGEHEAIVEKHLWEKVQAQLGVHRPMRNGLPATRSISLLAGLLHDDRRNAMSPAHAKKRSGKRYRYYVSQAIVRREPKEAGSIPRISAQAIEDLVTSRFLALLPPKDQEVWREIPPAEQMRQVHRTIRRVEIRAQEVEILFDKAAIDPQALKLAGERLMGDQVASGRETLAVRVPVRLKRWGGEQVILTPEGSPQSSKPRLNKPLIKALARAFQWRRALETGEAESATHLARKVGCTEGYIGRLVRLAFLAPGIIEAILEGRQPKALTLSRLLYANLPLDWDAQRQVLGLPAKHA